MVILRTLLVILCIILDNGVPMLFVIISLGMREGPATSTKEIVAYKSKLALKNMDTFTLAQNLAGKYISIWGFISLGLNISVMLSYMLFFENYFVTTSFVLVIVDFIFMFIATRQIEGKLKKSFTVDGLSKNKKEST